MCHRKQCKEAHNQAVRAVGFRLHRGSRNNLSRKKNLDIIGYLTGKVSENLKRD